MKLNTESLKRAVTIGAAAMPGTCEGIETTGSFFSDHNGSCFATARCLFERVVVSDVIGESDA